MIATPTTRSDYSRRLWLWMAGIAILVFPGLVLWLAARLAGGSPSPDLWNWPNRAGVAAIHHDLRAPWTWVGAPRVASPALFYAVCVLVVLLLGAATLVLYTVLQGGIIAWFPSLLGRGKPETRWAAGRELRPLLVRGPQPGRMILGHRGPRLVATRRGSSALVFGAPGSGKTAAYSVPIIQEWEGAVVAVSMKPDLVGATAGHRQRQGWVDICDLAGATGLGTCTWTPEAGCHDLDTAIRRAGWMLRGSREDGAVSEGDAAVHAILAVSLWVAARREATLRELSVRLPDSDGEPLREAVDRVRQPDLRALQAVATLAGLASDDRAMCCRRVGAVLVAALDHAACPQPAGGLVGLRELVPRGDGTLYVVAPEAEPAQPSPLVSGLLGAVLDQAFGSAAASPGQALERPLLVVLDGVVPTSLLSELAQYVVLAGAINATLLITFSACSREWYESAADDFLSGAQAVVFLGGQEDEEVLRLAEDLVLAESVASAGGPRRSQLAGMLGPDQAILLQHEAASVALWTRPWFQTDRLVRLQATRPYIKGAGRVG